MDDLAALSEGELEELMRDLMSQRGEAERGFKERQRAITSELDRRGAVAKVAGALEGLAPADRDAVLAAVKGA